MSAKIVASCLSLTLLVGGCTIHPQPLEVTGTPTYVIAQQIRCETRQAVIHLALQYLDTSIDIISASKTDQDAAQDVINRYKVDPDSIVSLKPELFNGAVHDKMSKFWTTGVAYNYKLDMTEDNNVDAELDFLSIFSRRTFGVALKGGLDRSRQNIRTFTITDTLGLLVNKTAPNDCKGRVVGPNYMYPIDGNIGIESMMEAFFYLSIYANLRGETDKAATVPDGPPTLVNSLEFTTTLSGSANPTVVFAPIGKSPSVSAANVTALARRTDKHQVVVGLAFASADKKAPTVGAAVGQNTTYVIFNTLLTANAKQPGERAAANAINQFLTQQLFAPTIIINNP